MIANNATMPEQWAFTEAITKIPHHETFDWGHQTKNTDGYEGKAHHISDSLIQCDDHSKNVSGHLGKANDPLSDFEPLFARD